MAKVRLFSRGDRFHVFGRSFLFRHNLVFELSQVAQKIVSVGGWFESTILVDPSLCLPQGNAIGLLTTLADFR
jgi:hypothetical protein